MSELSDKHPIEGLGLPAEEYTGQNAKMIAVAKAKKMCIRDRYITTKFDYYITTKLIIGIYSLYHIIPVSYTHLDVYKRQA